jgi:hypothetical protein
MSLSTWASFGVGCGEADLESFGFSGPAFAFGFGDAGDEVVADVDEPGPLIWGNSEEGASDTALTELILIGCCVAGFNAW